MIRLSQTLKPAKQQLIAAALPISLALGVIALSPQVLAQEALENGSVEPMGVWVDYVQTHFDGKPIVVHLRTGYERAVIMPEPVRLLESSQALPGSEVLVDQDVVGFYPTENFKQRTLHLIGQNSGTVFELIVNASPKGTRKPMQITR